MKSQSLFCLKCGRKNGDKSVLCSLCKGEYSLLTVNYSYKNKPASLKDLYELYLPFKLFSKHCFKNCRLYQYNKNIWIKNEGEADTGSIKEKEIYIGIKTALYLKYKKLVCVSSGSGLKVANQLSKNLNIPIDIYSPKSNSKLFKNQKLLGQDYEDTFKKVLKFSNKISNITPGINPYSQEGTKVISWQIIESGIPFEKIVIPCGNGSSLWGIYKGFQEAKENDIVSKIPKIYGVELNNGPIGRSYSSGKIEKNNNYINSKAHGIDVKESFCLQKVLIALKETNGQMISVSEQEIETMFNQSKNNFTSIDYTALTSLIAAVKLSKASNKNNICCVFTAK